MFRMPLIAALVALIAPMGVQAQQKPLAPIRPLSETVRAFEARGYIVRSAEDDGRTHEIEAIAPDGRRIEAVVEAASGEVLTERNDD
ncbi:PepSY domain-containing protein [Pseudogemmobacter sonorensis]|uniref:PepSY domain-containing protein n=1 Tax=Pseudogemmobacter sonorensis TaxID=2989681 RepID=UPI003674799C